MGSPGPLDTGGAAGPELQTPASSVSSSDAEPTAAERRRLRKLWARLIRRVYEVDPLLCQGCGSTLRVLAFVLEPSTVRLPLLRAPDHQRPPKQSPIPPPFLCAVSTAALSASTVSPCAIRPRGTPLNAGRSTAGATELHPVLLGAAGSLSLTVGDSNPVAADGDHRPLLECAGMIVEDALHERDPPRRRDVGQSDQAGVGQPMVEDEPSEVRVEGDDDAVLGRGAGEEIDVPGVRRGLAHVHHVVTERSQPPGQPTAGAAVDEEPHPALTATASRLSWAITARAYARQARMSSGSRAG